MKNNVINYIKGDLYRYIAKTDLISFFKAYIRYEGFKFSVWLRICHFWRRKKIIMYTFFPIARLIYKHYKYKFGYDIPYTCDIGPGLLIYHIGTITFVPEKCGKNMTISQETTVGMKVYNGKKKFPILGDNIYIAPGSKIIGDVRVGNNVAVGTNSVLLNSVPDRSVVVGIPGKVISYNGSYEYVNNPIK